MSISDRLDEMEDDIHDAFRLPKSAPVALVVEEDAPAMLAALRAVLDVCELIEKAHAANPKRTYEQGMEVAAYKMRTVITAALGEEA